jgi:hypothetical protein
MTISNPIPIGEEEWLKITICMKILLMLDQPPGIPLEGQLVDK